MKYDFDKIVCREKTACSKYDACEDVFGTSDVLPMWIADMDFEVPPFIAEAVMERANHRVYGYCIRDKAYYDSIIGWLDRRNGWKVRREWINFSPGVVTGFSYAIRALTNEGDGVVINPPVYPPFAMQIKANNRKLVNSPLVMKDGKYTFDFDDLDKKLAQAKVLLFCNPHNPTGRVFTREELERVGELCRKHNVYIVSDEIHSDLTQKPHKHIHIASMSDDLASRTITIFAPSKTFNVAGLSTSVIITPNEEVHKKLQREMDCYHADQGNVFGAVALTAGYTHGDEWLDQMNEYVGENMRFIADFFARNMPKVKVTVPESTYLVWLDFRDLGIPQDELCRFLIKEAKVGLSDGTTFGDEGCGFVRMVVAAPRATIEKALNQILEAYNKRIGK